MGQYWKLVNIDRKEQLLNIGGLKLWSMLVNGCLEQLVDLMRKPKWIPFRTGTQAHLREAKSKTTTSPLLALPQEVIDLIVHNLCRGSPESTIYLSLTCVYFFRLLGPEFQRILAEDTAPWAGDRLIIVGDYADGLDVGLICTSDELLQFEEDKETYDDNPVYRIAENRVVCTRDNFSNAGRRRSEGDDVRRPGDLEDRVKEKLIFNGLSLFNRLASIVRRPQLTIDAQKENAAVLRNLTARQYVRDDAIAESDYAYSLGEVVAVFTTWTNDGSGLEGLDGQGLWAGHRFDIATMADISEDGWTDVSELAVENLGRATGREKKNGKRASGALNCESATTDSSSSDNTSNASSGYDDDSYEGESIRSRRRVWID